MIDEMKWKIMKNLAAEGPSKNPIKFDNIVKQIWSYLQKEFKAYLFCITEALFQFFVHTL